MMDLMAYRTILNGDAVENGYYILTECSPKVLSGLYLESPSSACPWDGPTYSLPLILFFITLYSKCSSLV